MEPLTAAATAGLVMNYLVPAISELGEKVFARAEDSVVNDVARFGKQLLDRLLHRNSKGDSASPELTILQGAVERRVRSLADGPPREAAVIQLESIIEELLMADQSLARAITELLATAPKAESHQEDRSVHVGRDNLGTVISGDSNTIVNRTRRD